MAGDGRATCSLRSIAGVIVTPNPGTTDVDASMLMGRPRSMASSSGVTYRQNVLEDVRRRPSRVGIRVSDVSGNGYAAD